MKILCLQLARLGDILNTRPVLRSLRRTYPDAKIDILVRDRYQAATAGLGSDIGVKILPTKHLLEGLVNDQASASVKAVDGFLEELKAEQYDLVLNWSFSGLSSYIVFALESARVELEARGYSRYPDRSLHFCDPVSSYFFAQVGIGRSNRIHVIDLFAGVAGVQLKESDWCEDVPGSPRKGVVIHVGASESHKRILPEHLRLIVRRLLDETDEEIYLIGTTDERSILDGLGLDHPSLVDLVGKTSFADLFRLIAGSRLLIGADSAPIHIGSLVNTPSINISYGQVNFWETGPKAPYSKIIRCREGETEIWSRVVEEALNSLRFQSPSCADVYVDSERQYLSMNEQESPLDVQLLNWLYFQGPKPVFPRSYDLLMKRLRELAVLGTEQVYEIERRPKNEVAIQILDQVDRLIGILIAVDNCVAVLIRYFQVRKSEIGPGTLSEVLQKTKTVYDDLGLIAQQLETNSLSLGVEA